jgi:M6 family metalloprotease-like protein
MDPSPMETSMFPILRREFLAASLFVIFTILIAPSPSRSAPGCVARPFGAEDPGSLRAALWGAAREDRLRTGPAAVHPRSATGSIHLLVILAEFADLDRRIDATRFEELLFGEGSSMKSYYREVSGGELSLTGYVVDWVTLPETQFHYSQGEGGIGAYPNNGQKMAEDAVEAALARGLDLGGYDADEDDIVDALLIIHSGQGYEWAGDTRPLYANSPEPDPNAINSHKWVTRRQEFRSGMPRVVDYFTCPELQLVKRIAGHSPAWSDSIATIGVYCHEFGHVLGLPDLYDTQTFENRVGVWGIMDYGSWNRLPDEAPGSWPGHFTGWGKLYLGWVDPIEIAPITGEILALDVTLTSASTRGAPLQLLANPDGVDWSSTSPGSGEFFLAEVRTREGYDAALPAEGVLLYHVDESSVSNRAGEHPDGGGLLVLLPEDGDISTKPNLATGDPWPGVQMTFGPTSSPSSDRFDGSATGVILGGTESFDGSGARLEVVVPNLETRLALPFARPNPFRPSLHGQVGLLFSLDVEPPPGVRMTIYDAAGRRVRTLETDSELEAGGRAAIWDGRGDGGRPLPAGVYFFRVEGARSNGTGKVVLLR